jgi:hypothetical protein
LVVLPGMLAGGGLVAVPPLPVLPVLPVPPELAELLEITVPGALLALPLLESVLLPEPPPQAVRAAARIGRPIIHDPFCKAEAP